jgi:hypothetical protein
LDLRQFSAWCWQHDHQLFDVHRLLARPVQVNLEPRPADDHTDPDITEHSIR